MRFGSIALSCALFGTVACATDNGSDDDGQGACSHPDPTDYDRACISDEDCVVAIESTCGAGIGAVAASAHAQYEADRQRMDTDCDEVDCAISGAVEAVCADGTCEMIPHHCGPDRDDQPCDENSEI